jgi:hypothetical protein
MGRDILNRVLSGLSDKNIRFDDLRHLLTSLEFTERIRGDHHIFTRTGIMDIINIKPLGNGKAKPYQIKQIRGLLLRHRLHQKEDK